MMPLLIDREKYETLMEKEAHKNRLSTNEYSHSRDSAIDADLQEWETETLELDIVSILKSFFFQLLSLSNM